MEEKIFDVRLYKAVSTGRLYWVGAFYVGEILRMILSVLRAHKRVLISFAP